MTLRVTRGTLWITQEDDTRDVVLRDGDVWTVERPGLTIIEAQRDTTLIASGRGFETALHAATEECGGIRATWRRARDRAAATLLSLQPKKPIPYY
jgi:hypothetical protein